MVNWKNPIVNPPRDWSYYLFKVESKEEVTENGNPKVQYVHGCLKPVEDGKSLKILYQKEQTFLMDKEDMYLIHTVNPDKYDYKYLNLNDIL